MSYVRVTPLLLPSASIPSLRIKEAVRRYAVACATSSTIDPLSDSEPSLTARRIMERSCVSTIDDGSWMHPARAWPHPVAPSCKELFGTSGFDNVLLHPVQPLGTRAR